MIAPFTSYIATESRFMRYCMFLIQINCMSALLILYFTTFYRINDSVRNEDVLDQVDMMQIIGASVVGSVLLLPFISEPLISLCASKFQKVMDPISEDQSHQVHVRPRNEIVKKVLIVVALLSTISLPVWAIIQSSSVPASNQYCMATALIGSLFTGLLIVNNLYMILITCIVKKRKPNTKTCAP